VEEMRRYATGNLTPALETLVTLPGDQSLRYLELFGEEPAPPQMGRGHLCGFRGRLVLDGKNLSVDYFYHLLQGKDGWKIVEIYVISIGNSPLEGWARGLCRIPQTPGIEA
jgi:hypothetical protein